MKKRSIVLLGLLVFGMSLLFAHSPLLTCYEDDGIITCEGGFSNGASAAGVKIRVTDAKGNLLSLKDADGKAIKPAGKDASLLLDKAGMCYFQWPTDKSGKKLKDFLIVFDAGPGHEVTKSAKDIE